MNNMVVDLYYSNKKMVRVKSYNDAIKKNKDIYNQSSVILRFTKTGAT